MRTEFPVDFKRMPPLERAAYVEGFRAALRLNAWSKDGVKYVGAGIWTIEGTKGIWTLVAAEAEIVAAAYVPEEDAT